MKMIGGLTRFGSLSDSKISGRIRIPRITGFSWYLGLEPRYAVINESSVACGIGLAMNSLQSFRIRNCGWTERSSTMSTAWLTADGPQAEFVGVVGVVEPVTAGIVRPRMFF